VSAREAVDVEKAFLELVRNVIKSGALKKEDAYLPQTLTLNANRPDAANQLGTGCEC
jgi:hypothetical protein